MVKTYVSLTIIIFFFLNSTCDNIFQKSGTQLSEAESKKEIETLKNEIRELKAQLSAKINDSQEGSSEFVSEIDESSQSSTKENKPTKETNTSTGIATTSSKKSTNNSASKSTSKSYSSKEQTGETRYRVYFGRFANEYLAITCMDIAVQMGIDAHIVQYNELYNVLTKKVYPYEVALRMSNVMTNEGYASFLYHSNLTIK